MQYELPEDWLRRVSYERHLDSIPDNPVLVLGLEGWIDAGFGGGTAIATLLETIDTQVIVSFDTDDLLDHRSRRPMVRIADGVHEQLTWPSLEMLYGHDAQGNDLLFLIGPEPDLRWRAFAADIVELAQLFQVRLAVGLGAFPAPVPHTRPLRLVASATNSELAAQIGSVPGVVDVPAGIQAVLEQALAKVGIPAVGAWARVPHYASAMPYPAASAALIEALASVADLDLDAGQLHEAAETTHSHIDELIANSEEHSELVRQLEEQADEEERLPDLSNLPSGDELAAELERFLRGK